MEEEKVSINDVFNTFVTRIAEVEAEIKDIQYDVAEIKKGIHSMKVEFIVALNEMTGRILDGLRACQKGYQDCAAGYGDCREAFEAAEEQMENCALATAVVNFPI